VLPFARLTTERTHDFFREGLTDETIAQLARRAVPTIGVLSRSSVRCANWTGQTISEIGRWLRVDYVLEGSERCTGGRVRVAAYLVDAADETQAWAEVYDRELDDTLAVQTEVASLIAEAVIGRLDRTRMNGNLVSA
jgi:TolB-like protein